MMKLLLVEDDHDVRGVMNEIFSSLGIAITEASNGLEAIEILKNSVFDFIITDVQMPYMNGYEFLLSLKKLNISTPVIVLSGGSKYSKEDLLTAGALAYFEKGAFNIFEITNYLQKIA